MVHTTLVTGGLGFIGRHLVALLRERSEPVRVLDLKLPERPLEDVEYLAGSILETDRVQAAMRGVDRVFHLAANPELWARSEAELMSVNHLGTQRVLAAAMRAGVERFVYTSTESILQSYRRKRAANPMGASSALSLEDMPGAYCRSKFLAEQEALSAAAQGAPVVVVNPTLPIGPGDYRLTPPTRMLLGFLNGRYPAFLETGMNLVDVRDLALGHLLAAEKGLPGTRYVLGGTNIALSELLQLLHQLTGLPMPRHRIPYWLAWTVAACGELVADHITHRPPSAPLTGVRLARFPNLCDNTPARQELGLAFRDLRGSLSDAIQWYRDQGLVNRPLPRSH